MTRTRTKTPEALQQQAVLEWLRAEGVCAFRMQTGFHLAENKDGSERAIRYGVTGMSDILAFPWFKGETHPRPLWIEMKRPKGGRQTPEQKSFALHVEEHGMHYLLARGVDDVEKWLVEKSKAA